MPLLIKDSDMETLRTIAVFYSQQSEESPSALLHAAYSAIWSYRQFICALDNYIWKVIERQNLDENRALLISGIREFQRLHKEHSKLRPLP